MIFDSNTLRNMTIEELNNKYRGRIPHKAKDDDSFFKMLDILYKTLNITPTLEQHNILLAASTRENPVLVDSCPGSGKTTLAQMLTLIDELMFKVKPLKILNITYSAQAAADMKARHTSFCNKFGIQSKIDMRTMHSFYSAYLESYCSRLGMVSYSPQVNLLREDVIYQMLRTIYMSVFNTKYISNDTIKDIYSLICYIKDSCLDDFEIKNLKKFKDLDIDFDKFMQLTRSYETQKQVSMPRMIDFNDMQVLFLKLISENEDILKRVQNSYDRIIVDEYQDSSKLQIRILQLITKDPKSLLAIGDKDQMIYGWRGANPYSYKEFMEFFKDTELHTMGVNLRCPNNIIEKASNLISKNPNRNEKNMVGTDREGTIEIKSCANVAEVTDWIVDKIVKDYKEHGSAILKKQVILYRTHTQPMFVIDKLLKQDIPLNAIGTKLPYDDKMTRDFIDIYYMLENPRDGDLAFENLFKICKSLNKRQMANVKKNLNGFNKITDLGSIADTKYWKQDLELLTKAIKLVEEDCPVSELANLILPAYYTNYYKWVAEKMGILTDHIGTVGTYIKMQNVTFHRFMTDMIKIQKKLKDYNSIGAGITLGTVHGAKGLEYDTVYILDPNSKVSPSENTVENLDATESLEYLVEEMNIFYVGITRAKEKLIIPYNKTVPSRFMYYAELLPEEEMEAFEKSYPAFMKPLGELSRSIDLIQDSTSKEAAIDMSTRNNETTTVLDMVGEIPPNAMTHVGYMNMHDIAYIPDKIANNLINNSKTIGNSQNKNSSDTLLDLDWNIDLDNIKDIPKM